MDEGSGEANNGANTTSETKVISETIGIGNTCFDSDSLPELSEPANSGRDNEQYASTGLSIDESELRINIEESENTTSIDESQATNTNERQNTTSTDNLCRTTSANVSQNTEMISNVSSRINIADFTNVTYNSYDEISIEHETSCRQLEQDNNFADVSIDDRHNEQCTCTCQKHAHINPVFIISQNSFSSLSPSVENISISDYEAKDTLGIPANQSKKSLPTYKSLTTAILLDEPPKYEDVTGKKLHDAECMHSNTPGTRNGYLSRFNRNTAALSILLGVLILTILLIYLSVNGNSGDDEGSTTKPKLNKNFVHGPK